MTNPIPPTDQVTPTQSMPIRQSIPSETRPPRRAGPEQPVRHSDPNPSKANRHSGPFPVNRQAVPYPTTDRPATPFLLLPLLFAACHCATVKTVDHGVPHLIRIDQDHWRSGQPTTPEAWKYLYDQGVRVVIKLDSEEEASESGAIDAGLAVVELPIPPHNGGNPFDGPSCAQLDQIQDAIDLYGPRGVLWHCMQGDDRTGEVSFRDCVHRRKLPVPVCEQEMKDNNYHWELLGLQRAHQECP